MKSIGLDKYSDSLFSLCVCIDWPAHVCVQVWTGVNVCICICVHIFMSVVKIYSNLDRLVGGRNHGIRQIEQLVAFYALVRHGSRCSFCKKQ